MRLDWCDLNKPLLYVTVLEHVTREIPLSDDALKKFVWGPHNITGSLINGKQFNSQIHVPTSPVVNSWQNSPTSYIQMNKMGINFTSLIATELFILFLPKSRDKYSFYLCWDLCNETVITAFIQHVCLRFTIQHWSSNWTNTQQPIMLNHIISHLIHLYVK